MVPRAGRMWPARLFHLLAPPPPPPMTTQVHVAAAGSPRAGLTPSRSPSGGGSDAPPPPELTVPLSDGPLMLARLFGEGLSEEEALVQVPRSQIQPFERTTSAPPPTERAEWQLLQAKIDCLDWSLRHPEHMRGFGPPPPLPPPKTMQALVGKAVEVLWPAEEGWYKGLVESYDEVNVWRRAEPLAGP